MSATDRFYFNRGWRRWALMMAAALAPNVVFAARVSEVAPTTWGEQVQRFFSFQDAALTHALLGSVLMGLCCGLLGSFVVVRKMALMGDTLSHAVLPGVALGFLWNMSKDPLAIFVGATLAGLLGTLLVSAITRTTRIKEDAALGLVLASFFAAGLCLIAMIQKPNVAGSKGGLDKFFFGQAAAINEESLVLLAWVTGAAVVLVTLFYKEMLVSSFDRGFARSIGVPESWMHHGLMLLLAAAVVVALQAVGVVLVSAMLITPAATAYLLTDRMHRMLTLAAGFGVVAGVAGAFGSFVAGDLPTGPLMVMAASTLFAGAFFFGSRHGVLARWWRQRSGAARTQRENTLKTMFHILEQREFRGEVITCTELAQRRRETIEEARAQTANLARHTLATVQGDNIYFTPAGRQRAGEIVRNHRLWELFLTQSANIAPDHVHDDAEKIEHVLGEDVVRELERKLGFAKIDPHGKVIPSTQEIHGGAGLSGESRGRSGGAR